MKIKTWNIEALTGYKPFTTFYEDFSIADMFGAAAIKDTYKRALRKWKSDYKYITELVMVLNWKIFEHHQSNKAYAEIYDTLWREADEWVGTHFNTEELSYYYRITD